MNQLLLTIEDYETVKPEYRFIRPAGSIVSAWSETRIRNKWVELFCELLSPLKDRNGYVFRDKFEPRYIQKCGVNPIMFSPIHDAWHKRYYDEYKRITVYERAQIKSVRNFELSALWSTILMDNLGLEDAIGKDIYGHEHLTNTVILSNDNRKNFFVITNDDLTYEECWQANKKSNVIDGVKKYKNYVDWENDIGLSAGTIDEIKNRNVIVNPRFDKIVKKDKIKTPNGNKVTWQ